MDTQSAHEIRMLKKDLVVHDLVESAAHDLLLERAHLYVEEIANGAQRLQQAFHVFDARLGNHIGFA